MKNIKYFVGAVCLALSLNSCSDFLNEEPVSEIPAGDMWQTARDAKAGINEIYGLFVNSGQVVTFYTGDIATLSYNTMDMMNTSVYSADMADVRKVTVKMPDATAELEISGDTYTLNGTKVEGDDAKNLFAEFYNSFNNAYFESIENDDQPEGDAEITITYEMNDNIVTDISYIPVSGEDSNTYWAMKNDQYTGFVVRKKVIHNITSIYEELAEAVSQSDEK